MMNVQKTFLTAIFVVSFVLLSSFAGAEDKLCPTDNPSECQKIIDDLTQKIAETQNQKKTLSSAIYYLDSQIRLTLAEIEKTQIDIGILVDEISSLSDKIESLDLSLNDLSRVLAERIEETYKRLYYQPLLVFFSQNFNSHVLTRLQYLKTLQANDKTVMYEMEAARENFNQQKNLKKEKQAELTALEDRLTSQKWSLARQKASKEDLLVQTKNNEANFQAMLAKALAELEAIQSIIAGQGDEKEAGDINEGDRIATIISGPSACSTGTHLHFEVSVGGAHTNPAGYLKSTDVDWDLCGWYGCDEQFGFSGSWNWPVSGKPRITQGYGMTAFARSGYYGGNPHTGMDMLADELSIKAVKGGKLYRGSIACGGGTLRYVRVDHGDSDIDTYYLHVNYY